MRRKKQNKLHKDVSRQYLAKRRTKICERKKYFGVTQQTKYSSDLIFS